jgi:hypothetical protein
VQECINYGWDRGSRPISFKNHSLKEGEQGMLLLDPSLEDDARCQNQSLAAQFDLDRLIYWVLLLVYEGPRDKHRTGYCCGLCEVSGNTLYWASLGLMWAAFINEFKIIFLK